MHREPEPSLGEAAVYDELRRATMTAFCEVLRRTHMPAFDVLRLAAVSIGSVYREVADMHGEEGGCPCGWRPCDIEDLDVLQRAVVELATAPVESGDLRFRPVAGTA